MVSKLLLFIGLPILLFSAWVTYLINTPNSRLNTIYNAFKTIWNVDPSEIESYLNSYSLFHQDKVTKDTEKKIVDYYNVLNYLCSLGEVEKMYIPPVIDPSLSVFGNQLEYEKKIMKHIDATKGKHYLHVGCGRGGIDFHIARETGANITGINIDPKQLKEATDRAQYHDLTKQLSYMKASFNDPLPFPDEHFDGLYNVQALSYTINFDDLFKEMYRVLKPGAKLSFLEWVIYDWDANNQTHVEMMTQCKELIGAVYNPTPKEYVEGLERAGFVVTVNENASIDGHQYTLIESADFYFTTLKAIVKVLVKIRVFPEHFDTLLERFSLYGKSFIDGDKQNLWTSCHQFTAYKPLK